MLQGRSLFKEAKRRTKQDKMGYQTKYTLKYAQPKKKHVCKVCHVSFRKSSDLTRHNKTKGQRSSCRQTLIINVATKKTSRQPEDQCRFCGKFYFNKCTRWRHERMINTGYAIFTCPVSEKTFTDSRNQKHHQTRCMNKSMVQTFAVRKKQIKVKTMTKQIKKRHQTKHTLKYGNRKSMCVKFVVQAFFSHLNLHVITREKSTCRKLNKGSSVTC